MNDPKVLGFKEFLKLNEGNYGDPDYASEDWPSYDEESIRKKKRMSDFEDEEEKERLDDLFSMEDEWNEETGY